MRRYFWLIFTALFGQPVYAADMGSLKYMTEEYPPYNYYDQSHMPTGFSVELLQLILKQAGIEPQPIQILSWPQAYNALQRKNNTVLFSTGRTPEREKLFKWACPIINTTSALMALKKNRIHLNKIEDAGRYRIMVVRNDAGEQLLLAQGVPQTAIRSANTLEIALSMLAENRIDLVPYVKQLADDTFRKIGADPEQFEPVWTISDVQLCYAFNRNISDETLRTFQQALDAVRAKPEYQTLLQRYKLTQ